jgi:hypothetical protein
MLKRPDGTVITSERLKEIRGFSGTVPAVVLGKSCGGSADMDGHFYIREGREVCCWCLLPRSEHQTSSGVRVAVRQPPRRSDPLPGRDGSLPAAMGSFR